MAPVAQTFLISGTLRLRRLRLLINTNSSLLLDQSLSAFSLLCCLCLRSMDVFWRRQMPTAPQLSAAGMVAGSEGSEGTDSLLVSTDSSCMESVASCTSSLSSETQIQQTEDFSQAWYYCTRSPQRVGYDHCLTEIIHISLNINFVIRQLHSYSTGMIRMLVML